MDAPTDYTTTAERMAAQIDGALPGGVSFMDGLADDDLALLGEAAGMMREMEEEDDVRSILSFAGMIEAAERGRERIEPVVQRADMDLSGVLNRTIAFVEAMGLGDRLGRYLRAQYDFQAREEAA